MILITNGKPYDKALILLYYNIKRNRTTTGHTLREMMVKRTKPVLLTKPAVERVKKKKNRSSDNFPFDDMNPGDSFHYGPSRNSAIVAFVYRLASGYYETEKDGNGWRFRLLKKLPKE